VTESVQFFFDPICPWAYQASKWIRDVQSQIDLDVDWRFFSLEEINREDGKKHPWERPWSFGWGQMRVGALIKRELGNGELDRWYAGIGESFFEHGSPTHTPDAHRERIAELHFDPALVDRAIADESTTDDVKADHDHVTGAYAAFGVPTLVFADGRAVYGPVIAPAPMGDEALRLWEFTRQWSSFPQLYEMYTPKTRAAQAEIGAVFAPYLQARAWRTVQNPAP
jgi:predicted DsbA family dithiol-disulfide isomerase